ncbi:MAG: CSLREA domain-containing protein, partial [Candidatus Methylomirabilis sp.]|nr:CSLREA domain-containing protein [Deltaproteobacteria bacterium]
MRASAPLWSLCLAALLWTPTPLHADTFTVTKTADTDDGVCDADCSIREAVNAANALIGLDTVFVPEGLYTLTIPGANEDAGATGDYDVTDFLIVQGVGDGLTILDGDAIDRLFDVQPEVSLDLRDLTLRNGKGQGVEGGCVRAAGDLLFARILLLDCASSGLGGGAYVLNVTFEAEDSEFRGNTAFGSGGGFAADVGANVLLRGVRL